MAPTSGTCVELVRQLRALFQLKHLLSAHAAPVGDSLHPAAAGLLAELSRCGECRVSELAQRRSVDTSVISRQVAQLAQAGLVARRPAEHDARVALVSVTESGLALLERWRATQVGLVQDALRDWDDAAVAELAERMGALSADLSAALRDRDGH